MSLAEWSAAAASTTSSYLPHQPAPSTEPESFMPGESGTVCGDTAHENGRHCLALLPLRESASTPSAAALSETALWQVPPVFRPTCSDKQGSHSRSLYQ